MKSRQKYFIKAPFKGMMSGQNPNFNPQYFTKAYNIVFDKQGCPRMRPGVTKLSDPVIKNTLAPLAFDSTNKAIYSTKAWDNFEAGQKILVKGTQDNEGYYNVKEIGVDLLENFPCEKKASMYDTYGWFNNLIYLGGEIFLCLSRRDDLFMEEPYGYRLFKSIDNCVTWTEIEEPFEGYLSDNEHYMWYLCHLENGICLLHYSDDDYNYSRIYRSTDYGETWVLVLELDETYDYFNSHTYSGSGVVFAATYYGTIYKSTDYGATWSEVSYGELGYINDIIDIGNNIILAVGDNGYDVGCVLRSIDGGETWELQEFEEYTILSICELESNIIVASLSTNGGQDLILKSEDAGATWVEIEVAFAANKMIYMGSNVILADDDVLIKSEDAGATWAEVTILNEPFIGSLVKYDSNTAFVTSAYYVGDVFKTEDLGDTWEHVNPPFKFNLSSLQIYDLVAVRSDVYLAAIENFSVGRILRSTDGGETWLDTRTDLGEELSLNIRQIYRFAYLGRGIVVGCGNVNSEVAIVRSIDNGVTWALAGKDISSNYPWAYAICNLGGGIVLAATSDYEDICYLLRSTDYGANFTGFAADATVTNVIWDIISLGSGIVLYIGDGNDGDINYSYIFRSTEYGIDGSFTCVKTLTYSVDLISLNKLYDLGGGIVLASGTIYSEAHIYRSTDYGVTWVDVTYTANYCISSLIHLSGGCCVGSTVNNEIFKSEDYGATWTLIETGPTLWRAMADFVDMGDGIILSSSYLWGSIYKFIFFHRPLYVMNNESLVSELYPADPFDEVTEAIVFVHAPIMGILEYIKQGTTGSPNAKWIFIAGDKWYATSNENTPVATDVIKTGVTESWTNDFAVLSDKLYIANGQDVLQEYDQSTCGDIGTPPGSGLTGSFTPSILEEHRWSLWAAGVPGNPSRLFKSVPQTGDDFNTNLTAFSVTDGYALVGASQIDVTPDDGTKITGLVGNYFGQLIIFKEDSIHRILGATKADFVLSPEGIIRGVGAYNGTIIRFENDLAFADKKGIHTLQTVQQYGDNKQAFISYPVQELYETVDKTMLNRTASIHWPDQNLLLWSFYLKGTGKHSIVFAYNYVMQAWSAWTGIECSSFALMDYQGRNWLYMGDNDGKFTRFSTSMMNDYDAVYTSELETIIDMQDPYIYKGYREYYMDFNPLSGDIKTKFKVDNGSWSDQSTLSDTTYKKLGAFMLSTDTLAGSHNSATDKCAINLSGKKLHINIQSSGTINENFMMLGHGVDAVPQGYY